MTNSHPRARTRHRLTTMAAAAAAVVLTATMAPVTGAAAADPGSVPNGAAKAAAPARTVDVMTRNLYLGADLMPVIGAMASGNPNNIIGAATQTWANVQATKPPERMAAIADEIAATKPTVVGLQEVTVWKTYPTYPAAESSATVAYDFLDLLLDALAERGLDYREVEGATSHNFASPQVPMMTPTGLGAISLADRDVIIKRAGVKTWNAHNGLFAEKVVFPLSPPLAVERGWGSVDVRTKLATFRFVNAHLEALGVPGGKPVEDVRYDQAGELLAAQDAIAAQHGALPMVYVGDFNTRAPDAPAYLRLLEGIGFDAWTEAGDSMPGYTSGFDDMVADPTDPLTHRIDLVLIDENVTALWATRVGEDPTTDLTPSGLWPSDHAGVVARLVVDQPAATAPQRAVKKTAKKKAKRR